MNNFKIFRGRDRVIKLSEPYIEELDVTYIKWFLNRYEDEKRKLIRKIEENEPMDSIRRSASLCQRTYMQFKLYVGAEDALLIHNSLSTYE